MSWEESPLAGAPNDEVSRLIETLHETGRRIEELTAGEVDAVADRGGRTFLLQRAQDQLHHSNAVRQAAILDALPAHVALLDPRGLIVSVNEAWRQFPDANPCWAPGCAVGRNYLETCDSEPGDASSQTHQAAAGIRSVLDAGAKSFSLEYPAHSPQEQRWFLLTVTPLAEGHPDGAIVMVRDITERKAAEDKVRRLNRVYAVLSGINSAIVRVRDRKELFEGACRIAAEEGQFPFAWVGVLDPATQDVTPVAWAGESAEELIKARSSAREDLPAGKGAVGRSIRERRPVFNNDIAARVFGGPRVDAILKLGFRSQITLPLFESQAVVGTLTMYAREPNYFDGEELRLLTRLAGDISFALENISGQQKLDKLARIRAVSGEINAAIVRIHDRDALLLEACRIAVEQGKFKLVWIALLDHEKQVVRPIAWNGFSSEAAHAVNWSSINATRGPLAEAIQTRKPAMRNAIEAEVPVGNLRQEALRMGCLSTLCLPLVVEGTVTGLIALYSPGVKFFDEEEIALLTGVAGDISFALTHIESEKKIARLSRIQAVKGSINALIVRVRDRQELFDEACRIAVEHGGFGIAWIGMLNQETQEITPAACAGVEPGTVFATNRSTVRPDTVRGQGMLGRAIREKRAVFSNDLAADASTGGERRNEAIRRGYRSGILLPLLVDGAAVGNLALFANEPDFFNASELELLNELAGDISFALENISRQQRLDKLARIRAVSSEINGAIIRIHDRETLLRETCRIAVLHGKFELIWIALLDHEKQLIHPVASTGFPAGLDQQLTWASLSKPGTTLSEVARTRRVAVRNGFDAGMPRGILRPEAIRQGYRSTVCIPFMVDDVVVAAMIVFAKEARFFDQEELALLNEVAADVSFALQAIAKQEKLEHLSYYDALTGLPNRTLFVDRLSQQMRSRGGEQQMVALILLDIERFRNINESLGHRGGDEILTSIAQRLEQALHGKDYLARISSNGFGVIVRGMKDPASVVHLVEGAIFSCFDLPFVVSGRELRVAVKAGIAMFPVDGENAEILFRNAESALKRVQAASERHLFYAAEMNAQAAGSIAMETRLRTAVSARQFVLHYQLKIELATGRICGLEALIRWNDPSTGLVPPMLFIPLLEETGMIFDVGRWVVEQAFTDLRAWSARGISVPRVAVNVSAIQLQRKDFADTMIEEIRRNDGFPERLELEITESVVMRDVEDSIRKLSILRAMGVTVAIDDFGTGYSSLSYLSRLPLDSLKIDRSFVSGMAGSGDASSIVSTIISLAHGLRLRVVAEGVETEEQAKLLKLLRCDEAQGYLFAKPLPAAGIEALLRERPTKSL